MMGTGGESAECPDSSIRKLVHITECDVGASEDHAGEGLPEPEIINEYAAPGRKVVASPVPFGYVDAADLQGIHRARLNMPTDNDWVPGIQTEEWTRLNNYLDPEDLWILQRLSFPVNESQITSVWNAVENLPDPGQAITMRDNVPSRITRVWNAVEDLPDPGQAITMGDYVPRPDIGEENEDSDEGRDMPNKRKREDEDIVRKKQRRDDSEQE